MSSDEGNDTNADRPSSIPWPPLLIVAMLTTAIALGNYLPLPWPGIDDMPARVIGIGLGALGVMLFIWAGYTLWRHDTTVMPHKGSTALATNGPFAWVRNPIYLGDALIFLGVGEFTKNIWFVILTPVFAALVTWLAILPEERYLEKKFGDAYRAYKEKTRRWI
ncbi:MAG: isoprenylcysteine carboxylmethyltransferase family protein [Alphaproteobacteria bacterium]|nr:isoprenylcysteine carboxylmethyltransferase family protein [Alphaproteobacteria bacterium]